jgi:hypothetical protein
MLLEWVEGSRTTTTGVCVMHDDLGVFGGASRVITIPPLSSSTPTHHLSFTSVPYIAKEHAIITMVLAVEDGGDADGAPYESRHRSSRWRDRGT